MGDGEARGVRRAGKDAGIDACDACLRRTHLLTVLSPFLDRVRHRYGRPDDLLSLSDDALLAGLGGRHRRGLEEAMEGCDPSRSRDRIRAVGQRATCRHAPGYPSALLHLAAPPAVLHLAGAVEVGAEEAVVAIVGARRASDYANEVARGLGRGLSAAGVTVVSGMAMGVDAAAHEGALARGGRTVAVLGGGVDVPYPASKRSLYGRILRAGAVVSELPPGFTARRWCFPVRNRLIAALAAVVIVVEGGERSGSLITARLARELGREVAAVPGRVTAASATGPNGLIFDGAHVVRDAQDVLDLLFGAGARRASPDRDPSTLEPRLERLLGSVAAGNDTLASLAAAGCEPQDALTGLAELELEGFLVRGPGGVYAPTA